MDIKSKISAHASLTKSPGTDIYAKYDYNITDHVHSATIGININNLK